MLLNWPGQRGPGILSTAVAGVLAAVLLIGQTAVRAEIVARGYECKGPNPCPAPATATVGCVNCGTLFNQCGRTPGPCPAAALTRVIRNDNLRTCVLSANAAAQCGHARRRCNILQVCSKRLVDPDLPPKCAWRIVQAVGPSSWACDPSETPANRAGWTVAANPPVES